MTHEHYPSPQSVVAALIELTRYLFIRGRLEAHSLQQEAAIRLDA
jgi:hypothetical protein